MNDAQERLSALRSNLSRVIRGKDQSIDYLIIALLASGSVLLEDVPGVGKTTLAKALARSTDLEFQRVQFTPDLLPADILGSSIYNPVDGSFQFRKGPVFCNVLLADEINRASPRTQSALLEAMSERQATIEGTSHVLPNPFLVLATQNPVDFHGTYPLPEAQLDRFFIQVHLGYPDRETEIDILYAQAETQPLNECAPVLSHEDVSALQQRVREIPIDRSIGTYLIEIVEQTRGDTRLKLGVSPRGSLMLFRAAQASALLKGRDFALPDDVQDLAVPVLAHRLVLTSKARYGSTSKREIVEDILQHVPVPT
jgi:MoxR-like ATPase